jgi:hypothetical protein
LVDRPMDLMTLLAVFKDSSFPPCPVPCVCRRTREGDG